MVKGPKVEACANQPKLLPPAHLDRLLLWVLDLAVAPRHWQAQEPYTGFFPRETALVIQSPETRKQPGTGTSWPAASAGVQWYLPQEWGQYLVAICPITGMKHVFTQTWLVLGKGNSGLFPVSIMNFNAFLKF